MLQTIYFNILAKNNFEKINKQRTELANIFGKWENDYLSELHQIN